MIDSVHFENLLIDRDGAVATVTINRPRVLNALDIRTLDELQSAMSDLQQDAAVRCVVVTGSGDKAFIAGADIRELAVQSPTGGRDHALRGQQVLDLIENLGKPVIAAINGYALGGGCELAMACTLRIASDTARLGQPEINLGIIPGFAGTQRLARLVGSGRALELLLTGEPISAAEAHRIGLVNRVVPAAELMAEVRKLSALLASKAPVATRYILEAVHRGTQQPLREAQVFEATLFGLIASTDDMREGTSAFVAKRTPEFKGK
jgi:enoyl-CoA hydratase